MERKENDVEHDSTTGRVHEEERVVSEGPVPPDEAEVVSTFNPGWRAVQLVYLVFGIIDGLLLIRLVLKLLGANPTAAFSNWIYSVTDIFLGPFKNILPSVGNATSLLELSVVLAILVYALLGWAVARFVAIIFYRNVTVARRSRGGLKPRGY